MRRLWRLGSSPRLALWLLVALAVLLFLNVVVPQAPRTGSATVEALAGSSNLGRFFLVTLGLAHLPTSPVFLGVLALFFLNLLCVLADRTGTVLRRVRTGPPNERTIRRRLEGPGAFEVVLARTTPVEAIDSTLVDLGYRSRRLDGGVVWGVKNSWAPFGFILFHASFLLLCAGGVMLYGTRFVGTAAVTEGQVVTRLSQVLRRAPWTEPGPLKLEVKHVDAAMEKGEPVRLEAVLRVPSASDGGELVSRVNYPARWEGWRLLVNRAGVAPILWLQDPRGFTIDRVAVAAATLPPEPTRVSLAGEVWRCRLRPLLGRGTFPSRTQLGSLPFEVTVTKGGATMFEGTLRKGEAADLGEARLVLEDVRYWVGVYAVWQRGGGLLVSGFLVGIVGVVWRLLLHRREVLVAVDGSTMRVWGRSEYFSYRFEDEMRALVKVLSTEVKQTGRADTRRRR